MNTGGIRVIKKIIYADLLSWAWQAREMAYAWKSGTKVGCAIEDEKGNILQGWNIEGLWMTSIHAEVCTITKLTPDGGKGKTVAIVAETEHFTPCGACLDWLVQFCVVECKIIIQNKYKRVSMYSLAELCPHYPKQ